MVARPGEKKRAHNYSTFFIKLTKKSLHMPAIFRTKLYQQEQSIKMDNIASAAPMVGVVALAAAFLQGTYSELARLLRSEE